MTAWEPIKSAPSQTWLRTCRVGEPGENVCFWRQVDGTVEWVDRHGRTTITHSSFAPPTHWVYIREEQSREHHAISEARRLLEESAEPFDRACTILREIAVPQDIREQTCRHWGGWRTVGDCMADGDCHEGCSQAQQLEQSTDLAPASDPDMCPHCSRALLPVDGVPYCENCDYSATDPAPADRPPSEALDGGLTDAQHAHAYLQEHLPDDEPTRRANEAIRDALAREAELSQPVPAVPDAQTIGRILDHAVQTYRLHQQVDEDECRTIGLVDALTPAQHETVEVGREECRGLIDHLTNEVHSALADSAQPAVCIWHKPDPEEEFYETGCGSGWYSDEGMRLDEFPAMKFCSNCGGRIHIAAPTPAEGE